jgi:hypothetical protein
VSLFGNNHLDGVHQVIDLSLDERNDQGAEVKVIRDDVTSRRITINGLTILNEHPTPNYYFKQNIIRRVVWFVEISNGYKAHFGAFSRKRIKEVTNIPIIEVFAPSRGARLTSVWPWQDDRAASSIDKPLLTG